jgi:hypothetical protein
MSFFKQLKNYFVPAALPVLLLISSCSTRSELKEFGPAFQNVMLNDEGVFRGFKLGDAQTNVQQKETAKPIEADSGYLYYEYKLDTIGSFNITYNFDEKGLNEIQSDIFVNKPGEAEIIFNKFKAYFDQHYGESESQMGFNVWSVKSDKYDEIKISISNESSDFSTDQAPEKISIWIYPNTN